MSNRRWSLPRAWSNGVHEHAGTSAAIPSRTLPLRALSLTMQVCPARAGRPRESIAW